MDKKPKIYGRKRFEIIRLTKKEKEKVSKYFPHTKFYRSVKSKSNRGAYYMTAMHDQLRYLSGLDKTITTNRNGRKVKEVIVRGIEVPNMDAVLNYIELLKHEIKYFTGEIGGGRYGEILTSEEVKNYHGRKNYNISTLKLLRDRYGDLSMD